MFDRDESITLSRRGPVRARQLRGCLVGGVLRCRCCICAGEPEYLLDEETPEGSDRSGDADYGCCLAFEPHSR
ncbi:MAG: hypothetical protein ACRDRA_03145 [Pseudonocardiaceae bacterium]